MKDQEYMKKALMLALNGEGSVAPNPMVGAIIVKNEKIIGEGWHKRFGGLHAEREALLSCSEDPAGGIMYVTLEPCCHYGKTPPCTEAIIENKIKKVVVGVIDPNPKVAGSGVELLRKAGIIVETGVLEKEVTEINKFFFHYIKDKLPYVTIKYAMTLDGKIATRTNASKWITGEEARNHVHKTRNKYAGIMVGVDTVISDDPKLTCRIDGGRNPIRIICDTNLRIPIGSYIVKSAMEVKTYIGTASDDDEKIKVLEEKGCKILKISKDKENHINLKELMMILGREGIVSILLEGGSSLNYSAIDAGIVNSFHTYIAPKIFGGKTAKTPVGGLGVIYPEEAIKLKDQKIFVLGKDILLEYEVEKDVYRNN